MVPTQADSASLRARPGGRARSVSSGELLEDQLDILRLCDVVLGAITIALSLVATFAAAKGRATATTALLIWSIPAFNVALSRVGRHANAVAREIIRCVVMMPIAMLLYATPSGDFDHFEFPAQVLVVGQGVLWGCLTSRAFAGQIIAVLFGGSILLAEYLGTGGIELLSVKDAVGVTMTGLLVSMVAGQLGRSVGEARQRRDEAEGHKRRLESAVQELASAQEQLDAVLQCAPGFILAVDRQGKIEFANRKALPLVDRVGTNVLDHVGPDARELFSQRMKSVLETGAQDTLEYRDMSQSGGERWYAANFGAMHSGDQISGVVVISQDVTELKRTQAENVAAQRMVSVGTLAAGIAHEINTPIQFVNDNTTFLRDAARDLFDVLSKLQAVERLVQAAPATAELSAAAEQAAAAEQNADLPYLTENVPLAFETCLDGLERVSTIVRSMKEFAHPAQREMAAVDLNRAISNTLTIARNEYKYVADVETSLANLPLVTCYINDLNQAVLNLIVNAAHAITDAVRGSSRRGTIFVETALDEDDVIVSVRDTGTGIPEAARARIFEPFFTTKEVGKGTGQGLALVWNTVKKHGGDVTFETKLGEGTTFRLRFPLSGKPRTRPVPLAVAEHGSLAAP
ncbi:MAG TPA: ATP-binding protein [Polyangiaceae bacterium]|jgi:PAS domain S-box-containing protein